jgi:UDP-sugar pyrophosphorylase
MFTIDSLSAAPYSQAHLFEGKTEAESANIVAQLQDIDQKLPGGGLEGYLKRARGLLADAKAGTNPFAGLVPKVPEGERLTGETGPSSAAYQKLEELGESQLAKTAFCLVAGGLGERLGYPGIKISITAEVTTGASFMEIYASFILAFQAHAREATGSADLLLPLAIMTSGDTHEQTMELLKANANFGLSPDKLTVMKQEKVPALLDIDARIAAKGDSIETKPHGHGDVHALLLQNGLTKKWTSEGREWLVVFQDTNPLPFRSLCAILGVSADKGFVLNSVTVPRLPKEAVGGIATLEDAAKGTSLTINVEYNQLDPLLKETPTGGDVADGTGFSPYPGNINILVFKIPEYSRCLEATGGIVPEFVNPKWADDEKSKFKSPTRLECMMQDFPKLCKAEDKLGFTQLDRLMCFTCVKNALADAAKKNPADCALSAESDIYACSAQLLRSTSADVEIEAPETVSFLGVSAQMGARIVLHPSFAISLNQLNKKIKGKIRISKRSTLIVGPNASIDGLDLDGALQVNSAVVDVKIKNDGRPIVAIPEEDLPSCSPSLQIRGYTQKKLGDLAEL